MNIVHIRRASKLCFNVAICIKTCVLPILLMTLLVLLQKVLVYYPKLFTTFLQGISLDTYRHMIRHK